MVPEFLSRDLTSLATSCRPSGPQTHAAALIICFLAAAAPLARGQYVDTTTSCLLCHQSTLPQNDFCQLVPAAVWAQSDKHNRAFYLLHETDRADPQQGAAKRQLVTRILGFPLREAFVDDNYSRLKDDANPETSRKVATVKSCLRCHATWPTEADERYTSIPPVPLALGVSCQACHGPGEKWEALHRLPAWRLVTPAAKASLGCTDVRSPAAKARLCASCHVGDITQERFVKHEWYAAGHPPLPGFELAAFQAQMPAHWMPLREKGPFAFRDARPADPAGLIAGQIESLKRGGVPEDAIKASYREANSPWAVNRADLDPAADLPRTKDTVVGGVVVLESYVRLLGNYSTLAAQGEAPWPELALYDCAACHHELRSRLGLNDRPARSHVPGRPPLATWPMTLARLAAVQVAGDDAAQADARWSAIQSQIRELKRAATARPFGDPAAMHAAAATLAASLEQLAADASASRYDAAAARRAIAMLTDPGQIETNDYGAARQTAWAIRELALDLGIADADTLFHRGGDDVLALQLPSGPQHSVIDNLRRWLPAAAQYDAASFREELQAVRAKLSTSP